METYDRLAAVENLDPKTRTNLAQQTLDVAKTSTSSQFQGSIYFLIAALLGAVAVLVIVFALVLTLNGKKVDSAYYALGSAAIGGLAGVFASPNNSRGGGGGSGNAGNSGGGTQPPSQPQSQPASQSPPQPASQPASPS
jgi:hypothetical protein